MAQDYIKINNKKVWQPDSDTAVAFETTYTQGSTRAQSGKVYPDVHSRAIYIQCIGCANV